MTQKKQSAQQRLDESIYEMAQGLYDIGEIDVVTLRKFQIDSLPPMKDMSAKEIKMLRLKQKISQSVFAKMLGTTLSTVRQWEQGDKHPGGTSLKLLNMVAEKGIGILL